MTKRISERQRWVQVGYVNLPGENVTSADGARRQIKEVMAVVQAFAKVGRVVRVELADYNNGLILKARKA